MFPLLIFFASSERESLRFVNEAPFAVSLFFRFVIQHMVAVCALDCLGRLLGEVHGPRIIAAALQHVLHASQLLLLHLLLEFVLLTYHHSVHNR